MDDFHFARGEWPLPADKPHHLFHINRIEAYRDKLSFPLPPHRKTVHDLLLLTAGRSVRGKGLNTYSFEKNQLFFLPAYEITSHESMSEDAAGFYLHFDDEIFHGLPFQGILRAFPFFDGWTTPVITVPPDGVAPILNSLERLLTLYERNEEAEHALVAAHLLTILTEASQYTPAEETHARNTAAHLTRQYKSALSQHIYQKKTVRDYADFLCVTPNHLNKCVRNTLNKTAQDLLKDMQILEARRLLRYSPLSIAAIADTLCDQTPSNFARFFKARTGQTPRDFLESVRRSRGD
jgi:AraC-like DNA-binding protein